MKLLLYPRSKWEGREIKLFSKSHGFIKIGTDRQFIKIMVENIYKEQIQRVFKKLKDFLSEDFILFDSYNNHGTKLSTRTRSREKYNAKKNK